MSTTDTAPASTLWKRVKNDPRVITAQQAMDAFIASEAGQALDEACSGHDWRTKMTLLDEDIKLRYMAFAQNLRQTQIEVRKELINQ